jgi:hypothetical protein
LPPTLGPVSPQACLDHYQVLERLGFRAASLHCDGYAVDGDSVRHFRRRFGRTTEGGVPAAPVSQPEVTRP